MKRALGIITLIALSTSIASAELVGSLHIKTNQDTNGVDRLAGFQTRTGSALQKGTVEGEFSFLAGEDIGVGSGSGGTNTPYAGMQVKTFTSKTHFLNLDRFGGSNPRGVLVWDFDLSGLVTNAWELKVDYEGRRPGDEIPDEWYISFNGLGRTLDTTDVTNLTTGAGSALVADVHKYVKIGELPTNTAAAVNQWDLTEIVNTAITNGGKVRLVYHCDGYFDDLIVQNDSGLIAADSTTGVAVDIPVIRNLIDEDFSGDSASAKSGALNSWTVSGNENKDYNTNNTADAGSVIDASGMLVIQDVNGDEKGTGAHKGFFETIEHSFEGVSLTNAGDWLHLSLDASIATGNWTNGTPTLKNSNEGLRVGLTDSTQNALVGDSGYGLYVPTGTSTAHSIREMKKAAAAQTLNYGTVLTHDAPEDGALMSIVLKLERLASGDMEITGSYDGNPFSTVTATNVAINDNIFDTLALSAAGFDHVLKVDNISLSTSADLPPEETLYELWAIESGLVVGVNDDPANNPDADQLDNWSEYIFGGSPTNGNDIGTQPSFDPAGGYVYSVRNDTVLKALILTRADLVMGDWTTNDVADDIILDDGDMTSYTNAIGTGVAQQFYKLIVE